MRRFSAKAILLASVFSMAALGAAQIDLNQINFRTYRTGQHSKVEQFKTFVIRNEDQWREYWRTAMGEPRAAAPEGINFVTEELLAIHLGQRSSGGYGVYVGGIERKVNGKVQVNVVEQKSPQGMPTTQVLTHPWVIVRMPRHYSEYEFVRTVDTLPRENPPPRPIPPQKQGCSCNCGCCSGQ